MSYTISVRKKAEKDIEEAFNWYENQLEGLGEKYLSELERCYARLEINPFAFSNITIDLKQLVLPRFPFVIVF